METPGQGGQGALGLRPGPPWRRMASMSLLFLRHVTLASLATAVSACSTAAVFPGGEGGATGTSSSSGGPTSGVAEASSTPSSSSGEGASGLGGGGRGGAGGAGEGGAGEGGGGGDAPTSSLSSSAVSSTSSGCVSDCEERRCGLDACGRSCGAETETWAVTLPISGVEIVLHGPSSSVFVTGDTSAVDRIDACDGEPLAATTIPASEAIRGVAVIDDVLVLATNEGLRMKNVHRLGRQTLQAIGLPTPLPVIADGDDMIWTGAEHEGELWLSLDNDGDGLIRVSPVDGSTQRYDFGPYGLGRGVASTDAGLAQVWGTYELAFVDTSSCSDGGMCRPPLVSDPHAVLPHRIASDGPQVFLVSASGNVGTLMRTTAEGAELGPVVTRDPSAELDGWVDVAVWDGVVYASGASSGITGIPWLVAYAADFEAGDPPLNEAFLAGAGDVAWAIAADELGVYVAGSRSPQSGGGGFIMKCTHDLDCPAVP